MASVLSSHQRAVVRADTHIDPFIIDRCCDAFDALLMRGDRDQYVTYMTAAVAQLGYEGPIPDKDRPTAVDKMKTILIHAVAREQWRCSYLQAHARLTKMIAE